VWCKEGGKEEMKRRIGMERMEVEGDGGTECGGCGWWCEGTVVCRDRAIGVGRVSRYNSFWVEGEE